MAEQNLTGQQRAQLFAMSTRQNLQMLAKETAATCPATIEMSLPKARLLSGILLRVKGTVNLKHASEKSIQGNIFTNYDSLRRISMDLNNGFQPFVLSGRECAMLNMIDVHPDIVAPDTDKTAYNFAPETYTASAEGTDNDFAFTLMLTSTLNPRDCTGLILLQNDSTNVRVSLDFGIGSEMFPGVEGLTAELKNVSVQAQVETFSIPAAATAMPDLSVLKLSNGRSDAMPAAGQQIIKLTTGTIYRKILFRITDENGAPVGDDFITSDFSIVFNQADTNYSVAPETLRIYNQKMLGYKLPKGMYAFDFSNTGFIPNYGGTRDLIDSANLSELWLRFNTSGKGKVDIVTECLSRLS